MLVALTEIASHGGIPRFNRMLVRALGGRQRPGERIDVLSLNDPDDYRDDDSGLVVRGFARRKDRFAAALLASALRRPPRLLLAGHVNLAPLTAIAWALSRGSGDRVRHAVITHGIEVWGELRPWRAQSLRGADFVLAVSDYTRRQIASFHRVPAERIDLLPNALPPTFEHGAPPLPDPGPTVFTCCRLDPYERYKGVDHLIEAVARVRSQVPDVRLVVAGDGPDRDRLEGLARSLGIADAVHFAGRVSDEALRRHYAECAVFAMPSRKEGFGIVFLEAMRYGKPCIAANAGGAPEVVRHGETGAVVEYGDVDGLAFQIARLLSNPALARTLGDNGRRRLEAGFTAGRFDERLADILDERLGGRVPPPSFLERDPPFSTDDRDAVPTAGTVPSMRDGGRVAGRGS